MKSIEYIRQNARQEIARQNAELSSITVINYLRLRVTLRRRHGLNGKP